MSRKEEDDEDFDELMREIEREAREAADAHFNDLYEASTGTGAQGRKPSAEASESIVEQRKSGLISKLEAYPNRDFPVSEFSNYSDKRWVLLEAGEFTEVSIVIDSVPDYLQDLKSAICYHLLPATHPFGTIRSFRSSEVYGKAFSYVQRYLFESNRLAGAPEHISVIDANMLNQALDDARDTGSARGYNMLFFHIIFWMSLSVQKILPDGYCLDVNPAEVDTKARRQDVLNAIAEKFTGWKPFSEQELTDLLRYAFFWIDKGLPVIQDIQEYVGSNPAMLKKSYVVPGDGDKCFEDKVGQQVGGVVIVGFTNSPQVNRVRSRTGKLYINHYRNYYWRQKFAYAIDRVRNAVFILFCLMTGRRQKLSATPDLSGTVLPHVLLRTQR